MMFEAKKKVSVEVRGKRAEWGVICHMSQLQIDDMRADGCEVYEVINSIPMWVVELGLVRPWCFVQDLWAFRNPFKD